MKWSPQQETALLRVREWLFAKEKPFFYLGGYAGTGKTTLAKELAAESSSPAFAAYTGKATTVMRNAGCVGARTIHSLIYCPADKSRAHLLDLEKYLADILKKKQSVTTKSEDADALMELDQEEIQTRANILAERENLRRPSFSLNLESDLSGCDLLILDEASMVDKPTAEDLLSFSVPVLVLGDPAQLPPVRGSGFFTMGTPDFMLTEVHRQALDSPILRAATAVREGRSYDLGTFSSDSGTFRALGRVSPEDVLAADQVLVGRNATRRASNRRVRELKGYMEKSAFPLSEERLICLRNNHDLGIMNGAIYIATRDAMVGDGWLSLSVKSEDGLSEPILLSAHREHFLGRENEIEIWDRKDAEEFDFGYAVTVHKSQGSQWDSVVLFDESGCFRGSEKNWLYTGMTRASKNLTIVKM